MQEEESSRLPAPHGKPLRQLLQDPPHPWPGGHPFFCFLAPKAAGSDTEDVHRYPFICSETMSIEQARLLWHMQTDTWLLGTAPGIMGAGSSHSLLAVHALGATFQTPATAPAVSLHHAPQKLASLQLNRKLQTTFRSTVCVDIKVHGVTIEFR